MTESSLFARLTALYGSFCRLLGSLESVPPLLGRIVIGAVFAPSGWGKLHNLPDVVAFFTTLGIPFPEYQAPFVATVELVCGLLVLFGVATRFASFMLLNTMVVAVITAIWPEVEGVADFFAKDEIVYAAILVHLVVVGAGALSLDAILSRLAGTPAVSAATLPHTARA